MPVSNLIHELSESFSQRIFVWEFSFSSLMVRSDVEMPPPQKRPAAMKASPGGARLYGSKKFIDSFRPERTRSTRCARCAKYPRL